MKRLLLLLFFPIVLLAQNTTKGTIISGPAAARPTCSAVFNATTANSGDIYNDTDDVNTWKCMSGTWSVFGSGITGVQNNSVPATTEPFINFISPLTVTTNSGNQSNDITCAIMIAAGASHAPGCVGDPGAVAHGTPYYWGENGVFNPLPSSLASAAIKPDPAAAIQYVAGTCNGGIACIDGNDGLSWGSAKLTIYTALCSLPAGNCGTQNAGRGTVYVASGALANPTNTAGIWIMGGNDPNFSSPPTGWLKCDVGCTPTIIGAAPDANSGANPHKGRVTVLTGNNGSNNDGALWISAPWGPVDIENLTLVGPSSFPYSRAFVIGECSNHDRSGTCSSAGITLTNDAGASRQLATTGPCTDITGSTFWVWLRDFSCSGNAVNATGGRTANNAAAVLIDGTGNSGNGLIYIRDSNFAMGGIKDIPGTTTPDTIYVKDVTEEGDFTHPIPPVVWFTSQFVQATVDNPQLADPGASPPAEVQSDGTTNNNIKGITVIGNGITVQGKATVIGTSPSSGQSYLVNGQTGPTQGYILGQTDVARRSTPLGTALFTNNGFSNPSSWTLPNGGGTITTGVTDPFGGTGAAKPTSNPAAGNMIVGCLNSYTPTAGDWLLFGAWVKDETSVNGLEENACNGASAAWTNSIRLSNNSGLPGNGSAWSWLWIADKVANNHAATSAAFGPIVGSGNTPSAYGPVMYVIPAGTLADTEVMEILYGLNAMDSSCAIGSTCNLAGHPLSADVFTERATVAPTGTSGITQQYMDSTANWPSFKPNGNTGYIIPGFTGTWTVGQCATATATTNVFNLGTCGSGGGGATNPGLLNSFAIYPTAGTTTTIGPVNGITAPIGVFGFFGSTPTGGNLAGVPSQFLAGISGRVSTVASGGTANIINTDRAHRVKHTNAGATTISLPGTNVADFAANYCYREKVEGSGASDTITPTAGTINGGASLVMKQGQAALVCSFDNSNYEADVFEVGGLLEGTNITFGRTDTGGLTINSTAGGGTVTHTAGALTSGQLVIGNGSADVKVGDISGDCTTSGSTAITCTKLNGTPFAGTNGNVAGFGAANIPVDTGIVAANVITSTGTLLSGNVVTGASPKTIGITSILANNLVTATSNAAFVNQLCAAGASKSCIWTSLTDFSATGYAGTATGAVNVLAACPTNTATALTTGMVSSFLPNLANTTTTPTYNLCTLGAKTITKLGTAALAVNDLTTLADAVVIYDGTEWQLQNPQTTSGGGSPSISSLTAATASNTPATNANFPQIWQWAQTTNSQAAMTFNESSAATNGTVSNNLALQSDLALTTLPGSTATPLSVSQGSITASLAVPVAQFKTTWNGAGTYQGLVFALTDTAHGGSSLLLNLLGGASATTSEFSVNTAGGTNQAGNWRSTATFVTGTGTTALPVIYLNAGTAPTTFNTNGTQLGINTATAFTGNMLDFHVNGGASVAKLDYQGNLFATGTVDGLAPVTITTSSPITLGGTYRSGYTFNGQTGAAGTAQTYNLPTAAAGLQYCVGNTYNTVAAAPNNGVITVATSATGQFIIFTDGSLSATGGNVTSGGAGGDAACFVGQDSTHWVMYVQRGTWAKH